MKKDVIYIDIEDDITSIIEKIKGASAKIVALVPPKRTGSLQSVVNLKLLQKAASGVDKRVVLITSDPALSMLAAGVKIPVAKNLQSRPEVAPLVAPDVDETDVINGEDMAVGDLAKTSPISESIASEETSSINEAARAAGSTLGAPGVVTAAKVDDANKAKKAGFGGKIPNFDTFRKKLFLIGGLGVFLIGFLVWAFVFAPHATITITANTSSVDINRALTLDPSASTDAAKGILQPEIKQIKKTASTEFDTTGTKEVGERAKGTLTLYNSRVQSVTVPAGTTFSAEGLQFTSDKAVTVGGASLCEDASGMATACPSSADVDVTAAQIGSEYNIDSQQFATSADVDAEGGPTTGGSKKQVNIVAAADVTKAEQQLKEHDVAAVKEELAKQFSGNVVIIQESFKTEVAQPSVTPAVGEEAKRARLSAETTFTLIALPRGDVDAVLADSLNGEIKDQTDRRIYSNGNKTLNFSQFTPLNGGSYTTQLKTTGYIGPVINEDQLKQQVTGKRFGEIQQLVNNIEGVDNVDIEFSPFWVAKAPSEDKIDIKFTVKNDAQ